MDGLDKDSEPEYVPPHMYRYAKNIGRKRGDLKFDENGNPVFVENENGQWIVDYELPSQD